MKHMKIAVFTVLLLACVAATLARAQEQANEIRCTGSTGCKSGSVPVFATNGGSATVKNSIMSQSGSTINVAGNAKATGNISAGGSVTGVFVKGNTTSGIGVEGVTASGESAVFGQNNTVGAFGVQGLDAATNGIGVAGSSGGFGAIAKGIIGAVPVGVIGDSANGYGIAATSDASNALIVGNGGTGDAVVIFANGGGAPIFAQGTGGSLFLDGNGNLSVSGAISAGTKDFKIDHPLDPANKYFYHASVESSEMMNIYTGMIPLDASGSAMVTLPDWFEAVNGKFRYQLTAIGAPAPNLFIAREIEHNQFVIAGGQPGMKVSWQVTGVRHDRFAKAHALHVSVDKPEAERGYYIHPELYGAPADKSLASAHQAQVLAHTRGE